MEPTNDNLTMQILGADFRQPAGRPWFVFGQKRRGKASASACQADGQVGVLAAVSDADVDAGLMRSPGRCAAELAARHPVAPDLLPAGVVPVRPPGAARRGSRGDSFPAARAAFLVSDQATDAACGGAGHGPDPPSGRVHAIACSGTVPAIPHQDAPPPW